MPYVIGLTGGIGSGKSLVSGLFAARGIEVIDSDQIARDLVAKGQPALAEIADAFGQKVLTPEGALDRPALRSQIFADPSARKRLEDILHPRIHAVMRQRAMHAASPYVVLVIPLLIENDWQTQVDRVLVVDCAPDTQIRRVMARDGVTADETRAVLAAQATREQRLAFADEVIHSEDNDDIAAQVVQLDRLFRDAAASHQPV